MMAWTWTIASEGAGPLWESGCVASEGGVVDLVNQNTVEGGGLVVGIGLELGVDPNDKYGCDCRE